MKKYPCDGSFKALGIDYSGRVYSYWTGESVPFEQFMREIPSLITEATIKIGDHIVEFKKDGVQVGCTFIPSKTVEAIYKKLFEK